MPDDKLPSLNDFTGDSTELPSVGEFIKEESVENLPSVDEFVEKKEEVEEEIVEEKIEEPVLEETAGDLTEILHLINAVRRDIPEIPEIKSYDKELKELSEQIEGLAVGVDVVRESIPEVKYYDNEVEVICEQIDKVREEIKDLPEVKYYDEQVTLIEDRIDSLQTEVTNLPEVKYYDREIEAICEAVDQVRAEIPKFPKWVNEVNEVPDFTWIGKTFSVIDDDFIKVNDHIDDLKTKFDQDILSLTDDLDQKDFDKKVEINEVKENLKEIKDKIYEELKETALKIYEHHTQFKDDDRKLKKQVLSKLNEAKQNIEKQLKELDTKNYESNKNLNAYVEGLKEEVSNLPTPKYYDESIKSLKKDISKLTEKVETKSLNIAELYKLAEELKQTQHELTEENGTVLNLNPRLKQAGDPLTPTGQKFATLEDLATNYRLFVNRVEQQLYSLGGGGDVRLQYLDDIVGIATNLDAYDGMYLGISTAGILTTGKPFKFMQVTGASGVGGTWASNTVGVNTTRNVGIGTTTADSDYALLVDGNVKFTGDLVGLGTIIYEDKKYLDVVGLATFQDGIIVTSGVSTFITGVGTVHVGYGQTALLVDGDARVTGILTVGKSSITIDGDNNTITVGDEDVTITNSSVTIGAGVTISATASGINSAPNVLYVAKDGGDGNNGTSIDNAFLTIKAAVGAATSGYTIKVLSGKYTESNPIEIPAYVSIVGDDQRTVTVSPSTTTDDLFHVRKGCKLANMTFTDHVHPAAAVGFPTTEIAENVGGGKWKGPYVQNCTSDTSTGIGIRIDGDQARSLKAMNVDAFTQYNQGGVGVAVTNDGFAQLVSLFTICCNEAVTCDKGGQADIANSNCSFGTYGLVARGVSDLQYTGVVTSSAAATQDEVVVNVSTPTRTITGFDYTHTTGVATVTTSAAHGFAVGMGVTLSSITMTCSYGSKVYPYKTPYTFVVDSVPSTTSFAVNVGISTVAHTYGSGGSAAIDVDRPYDGQSVYFDTLYQQVQSITVGSGGTGYTSTPTVTIASGDGESATAYATLEDESVSSITIISSGNQYSSTPAVTIGAPNVGVNTATATAVMTPIYYTINSSTPVSSGISTLTLEENLISAVGVGSTAYFARTSKIVASSHTFEYVGSGNQIVTAAPQRGGVTVQANEVITSDGGRVLYTSTDQAGNFRIGDDLQINQSTGTISGRSFTKSLFSEMTPFILALS